ncbi:MAG: GntR family transcriptional regulator [Planctomycetota bacterium]|jgi:DNA-binding GntR family transcriptional regulator
MPKTSTSNRIRELILSGHSEKLTEEILVEKLGISRTPIRESLKELELEGIITRKKTGIFLHEPTAKEIADLFDMRIIMESYAAGLAASEGSEKDIDDLRKLAVNSDKYLRSNQREKSESETKKFHQLIIGISGNSLLEKVWKNFMIWERVINVYHTETVINLKVKKHNPHTHTKIFEAIAAGDSDAAENLMKSHLQWARKQMLEKITGIKF